MLYPAAVTNKTLSPNARCEPNNSLSTGVGLVNVQTVEYRFVSSFLYNVTTPCLYNPDGTPERSILLSCPSTNELDALLAVGEPTASQVPSVDIASTSEK